MNMQLIKKNFRYSNDMSKSLVPICRSPPFFFQIFSSKSNASFSFKSKTSFSFKSKTSFSSLQNLQQIDHSFIRLQHNYESLLHCENYDIVFAEIELDSVNGLMYSSKMNGTEEVFTVERHLDDLICFIREDVNQDREKTEFKQKTSGLSEQKLLFFKTCSENITKNKTEMIVEKLINVLDLYQTIPFRLIHAYSRKIQQILSNVFYFDSTVVIPLEKIRKILFFIVRHNFLLSYPLCKTYLDFHNTSLSVPSHCSQQLAFDNPGDVIIFLHIEKIFPSVITSKEMKQETLRFTEQMIHAINDHSHPIRFASFMMIYSQLCQIYAQSTVSFNENKDTALVKDMSDIVISTFYQIKSAEQKIEVVLLLTIAGQIQKVDTLLAQVKDQVRSNVDMLKFSDEQLQLICSSLSLVKVNHQGAFIFLVSILVEQTSLSSKCFSCILKSVKGNKDMPSALKQRLLKSIDEDHQRLDPRLADVQNSQAQSTSVHPSLKFQIGFAEKLNMFTKLVGTNTSDDKLLIDLLSDVEQYDAVVLCDDLSIHDVGQIFFGCARLRMYESRLFCNFEQFISSLLRNHRFEEREVWLAMSILLSYVSSEFVHSKKFIELSLMFVCANLSRLKVKHHNKVYSYLSLLLMRIHRRDFGQDVTFVSTIQPKIDVLLDGLGQIDILKSMDDFEIDANALKSFFTTLQICSLEHFQKAQVELAVIGNHKSGQDRNQQNLMESSFAQEIQNALDSMGIEYEKEAKVGIYNVDILIPSHQLIVEVNGPSHYILQSNQITQKYRLKKWHLNQLGYQVLDISFTDYQCAGSDQKQTVLIKMKNELKEVLEK